jgi:hypothetical protein
MLVLGLAWGYNALRSSGVAAAVMCGCAVSLVCLGGGVLSGVVTPQGLPGEEMSPLATRILLVFLGVGVVALLVVFALAYG